MLAARRSGPHRKRAPILPLRVSSHVCKQPCVCDGPWQFCDRMLLQPSLQPCLCHCGQHTAAGSVYADEHREGLLGSRFTKQHAPARCRHTLLPAAPWRCLAAACIQARSFSTPTGCRPVSCTLHSALRLSWRYSPTALPGSGTPSRQRPRLTPPSQQRLRRRHQQLLLPLLRMPLVGQPAAAAGPAVPQPKDVSAANKPAGTNPAKQQPGNSWLWRCWGYGPY